VPSANPMSAHEIPSPDARHILSIQSPNVSLRSTYDSRHIQLTHDRTEEVEWTVNWANPLLAMLGMAAPVTSRSPTL
jgi:hypothetical protein